MPLQQAASMRGSALQRHNKVEAPAAAQARVTSHVSRHHHSISGGQLNSMSCTPAEGSDLSRVHRRLALDVHEGFQVRLDAGCQGFLCGLLSTRAC